MSNTLAATRMSWRPIAACLLEALHRHPWLYQTLRSESETLAQKNVTADLVKATSKQLVSDQCFLVFLDFYANIIGSECDNHYEPYVSFLTLREYIITNTLCQRLHNDALSACVENIILLNLGTPVTVGDLEWALVHGEVITKLKMSNGVSYLQAMLNSLVAAKRTGDLDNDIAGYERLAQSNDEFSQFWNNS